MSQDAVFAADPLVLREAIDAPKELLWRYLSTSTGLSCWQADQVEGSLESGNFSLRWPDLGARLDLSVAELEIEKRIVFRAGATELELCLDDQGVQLTHGGLDSEDDLSGFESSWRAALSLLRLAVSHHPKKARRVQWLFQEVPPGAELLHCYFTERAALGTWLGTTAADFRANESFKLELFGGDTFEGHVLYAERDVCLQVKQWNDGALTMRSLPGPSQSRIAALGVSTWDDSTPPGIVEVLRGALRRLSNTTQSVES